MDNFVIRRNIKSQEIIKPKKIQPVQINSSEINVYTDGACSNNGKPDARAGFGVWFGKNDSRNNYESFTGIQTNNRAELLAIVSALSILRDDLDDGKIVNIYSDSSYSIRCCTTYGKKCEKKGWTNPNDKHKPIPNVEIVKAAYTFCKDYDNINFIHIKAHTGLTDKHSVGNENADRLANLAIGVENCPYQEKKQKVYLNVPYSEKDEAKQMGAKWDKSKKRWYIEPKSRYKLQMMGRWGM
jgi:ribonuclease HI